MVSIDKLLGKALLHKHKTSDLSDLNGTSDPASPKDNQIFFNTTTGILKIYFDGIWQTLNQAYFVPDAPVISTVNGDSSPAEGSLSTPEVYITGIASGDLVKVYDGETEVASDTSDSTTITLTTSALSAAEHSLTAKVTRNGLTSESSSAFVYTVTASTIVLPDDFILHRGSTLTKNDNEYTFPATDCEYHSNKDYSDDFYIQWRYISGSSIMLMYLNGSNINADFGSNSNSVMIYPGTALFGHIDSGSGSWTNSESISYSDGDLFRVECVGGKLSLYQNETLFLEIDAYYASGNNYGIYMNNSCVIEDFEFGPL
jgi:hypothetical protein